MTTPISPSLPPVGGGSGSGPIPLSTPTSRSFATDGLSAYSADLAMGSELTIKDFSRIVLSATNDNNATLWNSQQFNAARRKDFYLALVLDGLAALELLGRQVTGAESYRTKVSDNQVYVDFLFSNLKNYNDNLTPLAQPSIDVLNQAIDNYNNGNIDMDQLNNAIDFYNNDVSYYNSQVDDIKSEIDNFNTQAANTNSLIALLNTERSADTPPYEGQDLYTTTPAYMPTAPQVTGSESGSIPHVSFTPTTLPYLGNTMSPPSADIDSLIQTLNTNYETFLKSQLALSSSILEAQSTHEGFVQFYLQGIVPLLPAAFYTPATRPSLSGGSSGGAGGAGGAGAGISLSSIIASLSNPSVNAIIAQSIFAADTHLQSQSLTPAAVMQLQYQSLSLLTNIGLQAGSLAIRLLADRLAFVDIRSSPVAVALGLTLASEIALAVSSGAVANGVKEALAKAYPDLDPVKRDALAGQLTTALELVFLQSAVFQLAKALNAPQLSGQLLGSLTSAQALGLASDQAVNPNTEALRSALARNLANRLNTTYNEALPLISNTLISAATEDPFNNQAIVDELVNKGIPNQIAINTGNYSQAYLKAENLGRGLLDQQVPSERLNQSILSNKLVAQIVAGKPAITNRELRDQLAQQFVNSGNTQENALVGATVAVVGNGGVFATTPEDLKRHLQQTATARLAGLGNSSSEINSIANTLVSTVLGPNVPGSQTSIRSLIDERLQSVLKSHDTNLINTVKANLTQFLEPTVELYSFADALRDPANTFLLCAQTGLMYNHQQPSNYIKSVDIIV